jgi:PAS domain S-box-containing protein
LPVRKRDSTIPRGSPVRRLRADDRARLVDAISQLRREGGHFSIVLPLAGGDHALRWLRVCGFPVCEPGVELVRIVGFLEDITEHKLAEDALRDSEARLRTLFNHSPDLIFTVDGEANILLSNRPWPHPAGAAGEKRSPLILPPEVRPGYLQRLRHVFASGRIEHLQYRSSGDTWWEVRMVPISSATTVKAAMVVISDITENRKLQWQAIRSSRLASLGVLSAGIAHEINNPNHAILANAGLLARIWNDALPILDEYEQEQGDFLLAGLGFAQARQTITRGMNDIAENAKRIQKIVDNLKHLGKQDRGHMDELADIGRILHAVATLLDARIRKCTPTASPWTCRIRCRWCGATCSNSNRCSSTSSSMHSSRCRIAAARSGSRRERTSGRRQADRRGGGPGKGNPRGCDGAARRAVLHHQGREWRHRARTVDLVVDRRQAWRHAALRAEPRLGTTVSVDLPIAREE